MFFANYVWVFITSLFYSTFFYFFFRVSTLADCYFFLSSSCCSFMSLSVCVCLAFKLDRVKMKHLFSVAKQIIVPGRVSMHLSIIIKFFNRYLFLFFVVICNICTIFGNFVVAF